MSERDELLGRLVDELTAAVETGATPDPESWARRFELPRADVEACLRAVQALAVSLTEDDSASDLPQPKLPADFVLGRELGRGGMGVVYRAQQQSLDRAVAIKVLRPSAFGAAIQRFRTEARSLARLRHPHIVSIHSVGETEEGLVYYAMDLVDGRTLADELEDSPMTPSRALKVMGQMVSAISHAHAQGVIHRDLKPQNVLIDDAGDAFVVDFGLARDAAAAGPCTLSGELLGTPAYMSPEQARGDQAQIGEASDVWAMGALLYEMLTGRGPFAGKPLHETIRAILEDHPTAPRRLDRRIPASLEAIALKALAKRPDQRYATAQALGEDLARFAEGVPVQARSPGRLSRAAASMARHRTAWLASLATLLVVGAFVAAVVLPAVRSTSALEEARRALKAGYPGAALAVFDEYGEPNKVESHSRRYVPRTRIDPRVLDHARALVEHAAELRANSVSGQSPRAIELGQRAFQMLRGNPMSEPLPQYRTGAERWELLRAAAYSTRREWDEIVGQCFDADRWSKAIQSENRAERDAAWFVARQMSSHPELWGLPEPQRIDVLLELHRIWGTLLQSMTSLPERWSFESLQAPYHWSAAATNGWWSTGVEDALAAMAENPAEPEDARAMAFRSWARFVGLDIRLPSPDVLRSSFATCRELQVIQRWRSWHSMPREQALTDRWQLLADLLGAGVGQFTRVPPANAIAEPRAWLRSQLELPLNMVAVGTALEKATSPASTMHMLWRDVAWLGLPAGVRVPEALPDIDGDWPWSRRWWVAAGITPTPAFHASLAVLEFRNLDVTPTILDVTTAPISVIGQAILELTEPLPADRRVDTMSSFGARDIGSDSRHVRRWTNHYGSAPSEHVPLRIAARLMYAAEAPMLSLIRESSTFGEFQRMDIASTPSGTAVTIARKEVRSPDGDRRNLLLMLRLDEGTGGQSERSVEEWRRAVLRRVTWPTALKLDGLTPLLWPLPEALGRLQQRKEPGWDFSLDAALLAGGEDRPGLDLSGERQSADTNLARLALHAPQQSARDRALSALLRVGTDQQYSRLDLSEATLEEIRDTAPADEPRWQEVQVMAENWLAKETLRERWTRIIFWLLCTAYGLGIALAAWKRTWRWPAGIADLGSVGGWATAVAWASAMWAVHLRIEIAGTLMIPMWVALLACAFAFAAAVGLRAIPAARWGSAALLVMLAAWEFTALQWPEVDAPGAGWIVLPYASGVWIAIAVLRSQAARVRLLRVARRADARSANL